MSDSVKTGALSLRVVWQFIKRGGRIPTKVITVLLSVFSFTLFALGCTGYTYNYVDYIARGYLNYNIINGYNFLSFSINEAMNGETITAEQVGRMEEETGYSFVYSLASINTYVMDYRYWGLNGDKNSDKYYDKNLTQYWKSLTYEFGLSGSPQDYEEMGYTLLAGEYPTEPNQVAISEVHFAAFQEFGYYDVSANFVWTFEGSSVFYQYVFRYDDTIEVSYKKSIETYEDIIGERLGKGDPERDGENAVLYEIVGVVDTGYDNEIASGSLRSAGYPQGRILFSEDRKNEMTEVDWVYSNAVTEKSEMKKLVRCALKWKSEEITLETQSQTLYICPYDMDYLFHADQFYNEVAIAVIGGGAGVFFGIFAALLNGHLTARLIEDKQKKVGILRSMGASEKSVIKIFVFEALLMACAIFLLSLGASLGLYYGWLKPWLTYKSFGVPVLVYNGWTVLILAVLCFAVPLLCTIAPIKKFFKKTIVENITNNPQSTRKSKNIL